MGIGDELMAAGQARKMRESTDREVAIVDQYGRLRTHPIWENNPDVARVLKPDTVRILNCSGIRPYIVAKSMVRWTWKRFEPTPARIVLYQQEEEFGRKHGGRILVEPNIKDIGHRNKDWGWERWQELVDRRRGQFVQVGTGNFRKLRHVDTVDTLTFRLACAVLKYSKLYVGPEGGLHHAAAALGIPAIVIFGGFISPEQTGYAGHRNLFTGGKPCGMRVDCAHCREAMGKITVDQVDALITEVLNEVR